MGGLYYEIYKKSGVGRDPRTPAAEGDICLHTHTRAHLPDAGAPPLLLGWLRRPVQDVQNTTVIPLFEDV